MTEPKIGLCLSGGGFRAVAYHLGCLRGLHRLGLLKKVSAISCVSGGAIIGAIHAIHADEDFGDFEDRIEDILLSGIDHRIMKTYFGMGYFIFDGIQVCIGEVLETSARILGMDFKYQRKFSATDAFVRVLESILGDKKLSDLADSNKNLTINATELRSHSAIRFSKNEAVCWRYGHINPSDVGLAEAVAMSAAYPLLLPALERKYSFSKKESTYWECLSISDGGIYDNLGLTPFLSTNDFSDAFKRPKLDYIIACDAGQGRLTPKKMPHHVMPRMTTVFQTLMARSRANNFKTLHQLREQGHIQGFVLSYLGQREENLPSTPFDLIPKMRVESYPTDFAKMGRDDLEALSKRGEQLTELLTQYYLPELL